MCEPALVLSVRGSRTLTFNLSSLEAVTIYLTDDRPSCPLLSFSHVLYFSALSVRSSARPDIGDSFVSSSTVDRDHEPGASSSRADRSVEEPNRIATDRPRHGGASKGVIPKWFKGTGMFPSQHT